MSPRRPARTAVLALSTAALVSTSIGGAGTAAAQDAVSSVAMVAKHWQIVELGLPDLAVSHGRKVK